MNCLLIISDRHTAEYTGCYGNPVSRTPAIDSLARRGARFDAAYCLSPTCAPSRASMISGRYIHEIGTWCNSFPYPGEPEGWGHFFTREGIHLTTIGKLDHAPEADAGIADERLADYRVSPDVTTLYRDQNVIRYPFANGYLRTGPAEDLRAYRKDIDVAAEAARWLREDRPKTPWLTVVNFKHLHRPWLPTRDLWDHYDAQIAIGDLDERFTEPLDDLHPFHRTFSEYSGGRLISLEHARRAVVGYHGAVEILDRNIKTVLDALDATGQAEDTCVIYTSDHGGNLGEHRILDHGGLYEESIRVPLIVSAPDSRAEHVVTYPVSGIDLYPTVATALGLSPPDGLRGVALNGLAAAEPGAPSPDHALCQFHATGFPGSGFAYREGQHKYVACAGERSMLFDLDADPHEMHDLLDRRWMTDENESTAERLDQRLRKIVDPDDADARCKADQAAKRSALADTGQLLDELDRRGYQRDVRRLVPKAEVVFSPSPDAIP